MSDIFDLFGDPTDPPKNDPDKSDPPAPGRAGPGELRSSPPERVVANPHPANIAPRSDDRAEALARAVAELGFGAPGFLQEPDLAMVAFAVADLLEQAGFGAEAIAAERWATYEASGRRTSKLEEARARADALYRADLEAVRQGWKPIFKTEQSTLPWRKPEGSEKAWSSPSGASGAGDSGGIKTTSGDE